MSSCVCENDKVLKHTSHKQGNKCCVENGKVLNNQKRETYWKSYLSLSLNQSNIGAKVSCKRYHIQIIKKRKTCSSIHTQTTTRQLPCATRERGKRFYPLFLPPSWCKKMPPSRKYKVMIQYKEWSKRPNSHPRTHITPSHGLWGIWPLCTS